jgi:hypothetical protein
LLSRSSRVGEAGSRAGFLTLQAGTSVRSHTQLSQFFSVPDGSFPNQANVAAAALERPLTTAAKRSYDRYQAFPAVVWSAFWSDQNVWWSAATAGSRDRFLGFAALFCLFAGASPASASGCHGSDRLILQTKLSWHQDELDARPSSLDAASPAALARPPCGGEVPHVLDAPNLILALAAQPQPARVPPDASEPIDLKAPFDLQARFRPRLLRPPRLHRAVQMTGK